MNPRNGGERGQKPSLKMESVRVKTGHRTSGRRKERRPASGGSGAGGHAGVNLALFVLVVLGFCWIIRLAYLPESLDDIEGYGGVGERVEREPAPNLKALLAIGLSESGETVMDESALNRYLAATLRMEQQGAFAAHSTVEGVAVRLLDGAAEIIVERRIFGRKHTVATRLRVEQVELAGGRRVWEVAVEGGRVGRLPVGGQVPRLTMAPLRRLGALFSEELQIFRHASSVRLEHKRVHLGALEVRES